MHELHNDISFFSERMKIENVEKLVANLHDKNEYVIHLTNLKQALNHGFVSKKILRVIKLVSEPNYHTTKFFKEHLLATEMKKQTEILMNKPVFLGLSILELSKILMYDFWYDYVNPKLHYMETDSFILYIKNNYIYKYIAKDVEIKSDSSNYELYRPLPKGKNKK